MKRKLRILSILNGLRDKIWAFAVLFSVVVGAQNLEASIEMVKNAKETGSVAGQFKITLTPTNAYSAGSYSVKYTVSGTAKPTPDATGNAADYNVLSGSVVMTEVTTGSGPTATTTLEGLVDVTGIVDDDLVEGDETVIVTLELNGSDYTIDATHSEATITIKDNDEAVIGFELASSSMVLTATENDAINLGNFVIKGDKAKGFDVEFELSFTITGSASTSDYALTSGATIINTTVPYTSGEQTQYRHIKLTPTNDNVWEPDETVIMTLTGTNNPLFTIDPAANSVTLTINDDDCIAGVDAPVKNNNSPELCDATNLALNSMVVGSAGSAPANSTLKWSTSPTGTTYIAQNVTASGTYYGRYVADDNSCRSPALQVDVVFSTTPSAGTAQDASSCNDNDFGVTVFNLNSTLSGHTTGGTWTYRSGGGGNPGISGSTVDFDTKSAGVYVFRYTVTAPTPCTVDDFEEVSITVADCDPCVAGNVKPAPKAGVPVSYCGAITNSLNNFIDAVTPTGTTLKWSTNADPTKENLHLTNAQIANPTTDTYYGFYWDNNNKCASPTTVITLTSVVEPNAGTPQNKNICNEAGFGTATSIDLDDALTGEDTTGTWTFVSGGANPGIGAGNVVNFLGKASASYKFRYTVTGTAPCVDDVSDVTIIVAGCDPCIAGNTAPPLKSSVPVKFCGPITNSLNSYVTSNPPSSTTLKWSTNADPTKINNHLTNAQIANPTTDTYYGFYWDNNNKCASPTTVITLTSVVEPNAGTPQNKNICNEAGFGTATSIDLDDALTGEDTTGTWTFVSGGANPGIGAGNVVNFLGKASASYKFRYTVTGTAPCVDDVSDVTIIVAGCDPCIAGNTAPILKSGVPLKYCDKIDNSLNFFVTGTPPSGTTLKWSTKADPTIVSSHLTSAEIANPAPNNYYAFYWDNTNKCASPTNTIRVTLVTSPNAGTSKDQSICNETGFDTPTSIDLDETLSGADNGGTWTYRSGGTANPGIGSGNVVNFNNKPGGTYIFRYTLTATAPCTTDFVDVTINVTGCDPCIAGNEKPALKAGVPTDFCDEITTSLNDYTSSTGPTGTTLKWSSDSNTENESAHLSASKVANPLFGTYYGFFWDNVNKCASPALVINLDVNNTPKFTKTEGDERCGPGKVSLIAIATENPTINWYNSATGGSVIAVGSVYEPSVTQSKSFWVEAVKGGCKASGRTEIKVVVAIQPSSGIASNGSACSDPKYAPNGNTTLSLDSQLQGEDAGQWKVVTDPSGSLTIGAGNVVDFNGKTEGKYVFEFTTTGAQSPCVNQSSTVSISVSNCDTDDDLDGLYGGIEAALGTDPKNADTDGDGIKDGVEVGADFDNPIDTDNDGIINALDSNIADEDKDGVVDQIDPANTNPCIPDNTNGLCDTDEDGISDGVEIADGTDYLDACDPNLGHPKCDATPIDVGLSIEVNNETAVTGEQVVFTVIVKNFSERKVRNISIGDLLDTGFEFVEAATGSGEYNKDTNKWIIFTLDPLASTSLQITATVIDGGLYTYMVTLLNSFPEDLTEPNNQATKEIFVQRPEGIELVLEKSVISENPLLNDFVTFTIKVRNESQNGDAIDKILVEEIIATGVDSPFVYESHEAAGTEYNVNTGLWDVGSLEINEEAILIIKCKVVLLGTYTNTATILRSAPIDSNPDNNEMTVTVNVGEATPQVVGFLFNQFSPNGDGTNDYLEINPINFEVAPQTVADILYDVSIFNRYGNVVFEGAQMNTAKVWDGLWEGIDAPEGTYYYIMNLDVGDGNGAQVKKGWIQLLR